MLSKQNSEWVDKQDQKMKQGTELIKNASNEALEYITDAVENLNDEAWRKMVVETQALEMGIGVGFAEHLTPIYKDMTKTLHKKLKIPKSLGTALCHIYIGRVIKNIIKEVESGR